MPARATLPAWAAGLGVLIPLCFLLVAAFTGDGAALRETVLRPRTFAVVGRTLGLAAAVLAATAALALPAAFLVVRTNLRFRRLLSVLLVLPLAVPGYLLAFALLSVGGRYGAAARLTGFELPRLQGFTGSLIALTLYNFPYLFLTFRTALRRLDPTLHEAARVLGHGPWRAFRAAELPQLRPAFLAGGLIVVLHVLGDFGVVSLMRYETFSVLLYGSLSFAPAYAAWIALMMLGTAGGFIVLEVVLLRGRRFDPATPGPGRLPRPVSLGIGGLPALLAVLLFLVIAVGLPLATSVYWAFQPVLDFVNRGLTKPALASLSVSLPAALFATALAVPIARLVVQRRCATGSTGMSQGLERLAYAGYATPGLAFGLALTAMALTLDRLFVSAGETLLYQSLSLMIYAYVLHFLAEAIGPVRTAFQQINPRLEEAARTQGRRRVAAFRTVTLPLIRSGLAASAALVFLSAMKELPLAVLLRPAGYDTLAFNLWDLTSEGLYAEAAPFALVILALSAGFVAVLLATDSSSLRNRLPSSNT